MFHRLMLFSALVACIVLSLPHGEEPARTGKVEQAEVRAILIDAVVSGEDGRPVTGLTREDFSLRIDGKSAAISGFEDHCPAAVAVAAPVAGAPSATRADAEPATPPGSPEDSGAASEAGTSVLKPPAADPMRIVLYFDLPHLSGPGAARSVRHAKKFLDSGELTGFLYMVAAFGPDIRVLAPFTSNRKTLLTALDQVTEKGALFDEGPFARTQKIQMVTHETCRQGAEDSLRGICENQIAIAKSMAGEKEAIARRSLGALRDFLVSLSGAPGRKAMVFFTETLRDEPGVQYLEIARTTPRGQLISVDKELRAAVEEANAAFVSFYPVYAAGLSDPTDTEITRSQTSLGTKGEKTPSAGELFAAGAGAPGAATGKARGPLDADIGVIANAERTAEAAALGFNASVAAETGGRHVGASNDLSLVFPIVHDEMSCYYVVAHQPVTAADGKRHGIAVAIAGQGMKVRARPFYVDFISSEREARRFQTALAAPGAFRDLDLSLDAFALGRTRKGRQVLLKASVPLDDLSRSAAGVPPVDGAAEVEFRGRVTDEKEEICAFGGSFRIEAAATSASEAAGRGTTAVLHYEASCSIPAGPHEIVAAVLEKRGGMMGASRRSIGVPAGSGFHVGEAQLWIASRDEFVQREQAGALFGPTTGVAAWRATPHSERRLRAGKKGSLFFIVCPAPGPPPSVTVTRSILSEETAVATFPPLVMKEAPDPASGCWGVSSDIPQGVLGEGVYSFDYEVHSPGLPEPVRKRIAFAVGG